MRARKPTFSNRCERPYATWGGMAKRVRLLVLCGILGCVFPAVPLFGQVLPSRLALAPATEKFPTPEQHKIDSKVRSTATLIETAGINRANAARLGASRWLSSAVVRVDNQARIQVYIELTRVDEALLTRLQNEGVEVEIVSRDLSLVQPGCHRTESGRLPVWTSYCSFVPGVRQCPCRIGGHRG